MSQNITDPRTDPVGTVRQLGAVTVVKVSMGDNTGKGQHVWCRMDDVVGVRWFHHNEVARWSSPASDDTTAATVADFCAERAQYITAINNCHPDNASDYYRWQGGAEARRQLSERLGLPIAWPAEYKDRKVAR